MIDWSEFKADFLIPASERCSGVFEAVSTECKTSGVCIRFYDRVFFIPYDPSPEHGLDRYRWTYSSHDRAREFYTIFSPVSADVRNAILYRLRKGIRNGNDRILKII